MLFKDTILSSDKQTYWVHMLLYPHAGSCCGDTQEPPYIVTKVPTDRRDRRDPVSQRSGLARIYGALESGATPSHCVGLWVGKVGLWEEKSRFERSK